MLALKARLMAILHIFHVIAYEDQKSKRAAC
jgi:hypothetical protein